MYTWCYIIHTHKQGSHYQTAPKQMFETKRLDMPTDYIKCHIEKRDWTAKTGKTGSTYCINNQLRETAEIFGHKAKVTIAKKGEDFNSSEGFNVFAWLDEMTAAMHEAFLEEYGVYVYSILGRA